LIVKNYVQNNAQERNFNFASTCDLLNLHFLRKISRISRIRAGDIPISEKKVKLDCVKVAK
jgi:hypothetical protein